MRARTVSRLLIARRKLNPQLLREYERVGVDRQLAMRLYTKHLLDRAPKDFNPAGSTLVVYVAGEIALGVLTRLPDQAGTERFVEALIQDAL